jgi:hypothetical protein
MTPGRIERETLIAAARSATSSGPSASTPRRAISPTSRRRGTRGSPRSSGWRRSADGAYAATAVGADRRSGR